MDESETAQRLPRAFLVSVYKGSADQKACIEHLDELEFLSETYGVEVVGKTPCSIRKYTAATLVTEGKLEELIELSKECKAELVIFDDEISPAQQRNLEKRFGIPVMDRTGVILEVFAKHAKTREARLQVELAKVRYEAPRLKRMWTHLERQSGTSGGGGGGGGGYLRSVGEKQIEIDRRILKKRIASLQSELDEVKASREVQRSQRVRTETPTFALIGYTNVGKSTLLNALTDADVLVENKLFATLDTTTRKYTLGNNQEILLIDTVGFIRKLPHLLVASFKSTLEEAFEADILLHIVDVSQPEAIDQAATTFEVLEELNVKDKPIITVLNKVDAAVDATVATKLRVTYPKTVEISALNRQGFDKLEELMVEELSKRRQVVTLRVPQSEYHAVSEAMREGNVIHQDYEGNDVLLKIDLPNAVAGKLKKYAI